MKGANRHSALSFHEKINENTCRKFVTIFGYGWGQLKMCSSGLPFDDDRTFERNVTEIKDDTSSFQDSFLVPYFVPEASSWGRRC